ncbi:MAG: universal stress protein [Dehalococcoidia bacterium]
MAQTILLPITTKDIESAIDAAETIADAARTQGATILVLETDCLHGWLFEIEHGYEHLELQRIHNAAERVAAALREQGATVEVVWECVRGQRRPVDAETCRRHGADAVFLPHAHRRRSIFEGATLRRLRHEGITVLEPEPATRRGAAGGRVATWDD